MAERRQIGSFDYIVVGAGSAGCVIANRLSADPNTSVLVLEAGGNDNYHWIHIPVGYIYTQMNPRTDWCFKTEVEDGLNGRAINYPRGKVLGGCSSINGMLYLRGQARDYDLWRQMGNVGWSWDDVLPYFLRSEDHYQGKDEMHGAGGEWRVDQQRLKWDILEAVRAAAVEAGIPETDDFNRGNNEGVGYFQVNQRGGIRWTTTKGFLRPAMKRPNVTVLTHAHAEGLRLDGKRAVGLDLRLKDEPVTAVAKGEVVMAAGAVGTPQLLELSGIGNPDVLSAHGIPVVHQLNGVGENLQDHLQLRLIYKIQNAVTLNQRANSLFGKIGMGLDYFARRRGPLSMAPSQLGAFAKSDDNRETPNLEYHIQPLSLDRFGEPLHSFPAITMSVCNIRPESRGTVHVRDAAHDSAPVIKPNYLSTTGDRQVAVDAIRLTRRIMAATPLKPHAPEEYLPGAGHETDDELASAAGDIGTTIYHPVGTCKMGPDPMAVVDERLRVHGVDGLRVVDASVMPTITSGNTNSPVIMIAEKAAEMMVEDRRA